MAADLTHFLVQQLAAAGVEIRGAEDHAPNLKAFCFEGHDRKTPSLSIRKADGAFYCFGCGVRGPNWNALAKYIGGKKLRQQDLPDPFGLLHDHLSRHIARMAAEAELPWGLEPWTQGKHRGLSPAFLTRLEAHRWYDDFMRCYRVFFPIQQQGELMGWVARRLDKSDEMKYRNAPRMPAKRILYPHDFAHRYFDCRTVALVEGPMDALRLCHFRIPALAIMGTNNWHDRKRSLLLNLGVQRVVIATDGDAAGKKCRYDSLEPSLMAWFDVEHFFPPEGDDPGSMKRKHVERLRRMVA